MSPAADARPRPPEIGKSVVAGGVRTNYHDLGDNQGQGWPVVFIHGSGPGVSAWANWRLALPVVGQRLRTLAYDQVGFGYSDLPADTAYSLQRWLEHLVGFLDTLGIQKAHLVGNSMGAAVALAAAVVHPDRVERLVLMGAMGVRFPITEGLDAVWGYQPSTESMKRLIGLFAYNRALATDELAELRYRASVLPGAQESFSSMFPAPRQRGVDNLASYEDRLGEIQHRTLIVHGREDQVIPLQTSLTLMEIIENAQLHVFGHCGHWTQIEQAAAFSRLVADFLTEA